MSKFGEWLREVDAELSLRVRSLESWTGARLIIIGFQANLGMFMNLYKIWQNNHNAHTAVNYLMGSEQ